MENSEDKKNKTPKKTPEKEKRDDEGIGRQNPLRKLIDFLVDVKRELKKVAWPTRSDTLASTWVVITITFIFSIFFFLCDSVLMFLIKLTFV